MGFKFTYICDLLSQLESSRVAKATTAAKLVSPEFAIVTQWFNRYQKQIHDGNTDRLAFVSCLFPEKRPDRVYGLREPSLVKLIGRCLLLGASRKQDLDRWKERGGGDLGECVENVMRQAENHLCGLPEVTVEEVDYALARIASNSRFSGSIVRRMHSAVDVEDTLAPMFRRLSSRDAKWLTRLILKDFSPLVLPVQLVLRTFHFLLPTLLTFQDSLEAALNLLDHEPIKSFPPRPSRDLDSHLTQNITPDLTPRIGVKIGRPDFYKARSIQHCCAMAGKRKMSLERKYDGEYCQIHIDLSKGRNCIQIFSKSGKDSTEDRRQVHQAIKDCLKIGTDDCQFSERCILEGELLVWSDEISDILPFHKLRKHIPRSGSFLGTENDSPQYPHEHLYIAFFDILLRDDNICLAKHYTERRRVLHETVKAIDGLGTLAEQINVDFSLTQSRERLKDKLAMAAAQRWEGLVLKACDEPYFSLRQHNGDDYSGPWIKFKKEYIPGLGDTADLVLVGARYDTCDAAGLRDSVQPLWWTKFFLGCLETPQVNASSTVPQFRVVDVIDRNNMHVNLMKDLNQVGQFHACLAGSSTLPFTLKPERTQLPEMDVIFRKPFVVEMSGSGFGRPPNARYFTLRFPRVLKIHSDRAFEDATSFEDLQRLAEVAQSVPAEELSQEAAMWANRLDPVDESSEYIVDHSESSCLSIHSGNGSGSTASDANPNSTDIGPCESQPGNPISLQSSGIGTEQKRKAVVLGAARPVKKQKTSSQQSQTITVRSDPAESVLPVHTTARVSSGRCLTDLVNIPARRSQEDQASRSHYSVSSSLSQRSVSHDFSLRAQGFRKRKETHSTSSSKGDHSSQTPSTRISQRRIARHKSRGSRIQSIVETTALANNPTTVPILLGPTLSGGNLQAAQQHLTKSNVSFTASVTEFINSVSGAKYLSHSLRRHNTYQPTASHHGVVLIDSNAPMASNIASDIASIGNALISCHGEDKLFGSGKIVFLHWHILRYGVIAGKGDARDKVLAVDSWERVGKGVFAGCLKWGSHVIPPGRKRLKPAGDDDDGTARNTDNGSGKVVPGANGAKRSDESEGVAVSWDWKESLFLFQRGGPRSDCLR